MGFASLSYHTFSALKRVEMVVVAFPRARRPTFLAQLVARFAAEVARNEARSGLQAER